MSDDLKDRARFVVQLFRECNAIHLPHKPTEEVLLGMIDRIEELEAKLAKAVGVLDEAWYILTVPLLDYEPEPEEPSLRRIKDTLAELKGEDRG